MDYALNCLRTKETFKNVVFIDETTIEMCSNGKLYFYKPRLGMQQPQYKKQKPKHSYKVCFILALGYAAHFLL